MRENQAGYVRATGSVQLRQDAATRIKKAEVFMVPTFRTIRPGRVSGLPESAYSFSTICWLR